MTARKEMRIRRNTPSGEQLEVLLVPMTGQHTKTATGLDYYGAYVTDRFSGETGTTIISGASHQEAADDAVAWWHEGHPISDEWLAEKQRQAKLLGDAIIQKQGRLPSHLDDLEPAAYNTLKRRCRREGTYALFCGAARRAEWTVAGLLAQYLERQEAETR